MLKAAVLDRLWTRMSERGDFPMLSQSLRTTMAAMNNDDLDFTGLVQVVLSDFALTQKVLRLANSAMYMAFGGNITTVSRALMVLGMDAVGHLVVGLKIVDHFHHSAPRRIDAKLELNRTLLSGCVARKLTERGDLRAGEEAVVCTLMRQIGKLLVVFYLDAEWDQIRRHIDERHAGSRRLCAGARRDLRRDRRRSGGALASARHDPLGHARVRSAGHGKPRQVQWLRAITNYSTAVADVLTQQSMPDFEREERIAELAQNIARIEYGPRGAAGNECGARPRRRRRRRDGEIVELRANADAIAREALTPKRALRRVSRICAACPRPVRSRRRSQWLRKPCWRRLALRARWCSSSTATARSRHAWVWARRSIRRCPSLRS